MPRLPRPSVGRVAAITPVRQPRKDTTKLRDSAFLSEAKAEGELAVAEQDSGSRPD